MAAGDIEQWQQLAAECVAKNWGIHDVPRSHDLGVNNRTWELNGLWLSCRPTVERGTSLRVLRLAEYIRNTCSESGITAAEPIRSRAGDALVDFGGQVWVLTRDVPGQMPDQRDLNSYPPLARGIARLHAVLASPEQHAVDPEGSIAFVKKLITVGPSSLDIGVPLQSKERDALVLALERVDAHFDVLAALPTQLTHGDVSHPNLIVDRAGELVGVLDLEFARVDPVVFDLGTLCLSLLTRTDDPQPARTIRCLLGTYQTNSINSFPLALIFPSMLILKLWSYFRHGERAANGEIGWELAQSQSEKCQLVMTVWDQFKAYSRQ